MKSNLQVISLEDYSGRLEQFLGLGWMHTGKTSMNAHQCMKTDNEYSLFM